MVFLPCGLTCSNNSVNGLDTWLEACSWQYCEFNTILYFSALFGCLTKGSYMS
uniref:Uncharacterized protein n=1 Tax=Anguilla anguilla TaxID=7936 RepID=A0A0E9QJJ7_ANGAN